MSLTDGFALGFGIGLGLVSAVFAFYLVVFLLFGLSY